MKTISFKIEYTNRESINYDSKVYSSIMRYSLELFFKGLTTTQVYQNVCSKFKLNSHLCNCALREGYGIYKAELLKQKEFKKNNKIYHKPAFGNLIKLNKGLITKDEYNKQRNRGIFSEGENGCAKGNRLFKIDLQNNSVIYKRSRNEHIELKIKEKLSDKRKRILESLYLTMENKVSPVSFRVKDDNLYISYDESVVEQYKRFKDLKSNRILGVDLNPNYIGLSILEFDKNNNFKIIHKRVFDLSELNEQSTNKVKYELQQIDNDILRLCKHFRVSKLCVEDLKFKKSNKFWSKKLNKLCKNKFRYCQIKNHLQTLCSVYGVEFIEVNACYSSFVGNFCYGNDNTPDPIAASIELARRGYKKFSKEWFYPPLIDGERIKEVLGNQWKKELKLAYKSWKTFFNQIKKLGLKYRFQLDGSKAVFSKDYYKKKTILYCFI